MSDKPEQKKHKVIKDRYAKSRGGNSHFLDIHCAQCGVHVVLYQKDGPGSLLRLYLDRIFEPSEKAAWQYLAPIVKVPNLTCPKCGALIGTPMIYEAENRRAIRLQRGAFIKKKSDGTYTHDEPEEKKSEDDESPPVGE